MDHFSKSKVGIQWKWFNLLSTMKLLLFNILGINNEIAPNRLMLGMMKDKQI